MVGVVPIISAMASSGQGFRFMRIMCLAVVALVIVIAVFPDDSEGFQALEYDDSHVFQVGEHNVRIQTRSFSFGSGDNGKAELIVDCSDRRTRPESDFDNDLYSDIRPAYVSWANLDHDHQKDLLIWKPASSHQLEATGFVSSVDGKLRLMVKHRSRRISGW